MDTHYSSAKDTKYLSDMELSVAKLDISKLIHVLEDCAEKISQIDDNGCTESSKESNLTMTKPTVGFQQSMKKQFLELFNSFIKSSKLTMVNACVPESDRRDSVKSQREWNDGKESKKEIEELKHKIEMIKEKYRREEETKTKLIEEYRKAIELIEMKKKEELHDIAKSADEKMVLEWQAVEYELNNLQTEEKVTQRKYEYLCKENLMNEKELREMKAKCENKLTNFIALYDKDIGKKHTEYENIVEQKQLEKQQLETLMELFESQTPTYQTMTEEKAIWKEKELAKKLHKLRTMLAYNSISKFLNNYVKTLRENNIPIVITKKSRGKKKKQ
ncbi:hypothetical protein WDU94_014190 [Cyamophila willieti]